MYRVKIIVILKYTILDCLEKCNQTKSNMLMHNVSTFQRYLIMFQLDKSTFLLLQVEFYHIVL